MAESPFSEFSSITPSQWLEKIREELKGKDPDTLKWMFANDIEVHPFYFDVPAEITSKAELVRRAINAHASNRNAKGEYFLNFSPSNAEEWKQFISASHLDGLQGLRFEFNDALNKNLSVEELNALIVSTLQTGVKFHFAGSGDVFRLANSLSSEILSHQNFCLELDPFSFLVSNGGFPGNETDAFSLVEKLLSQSANIRLSLLPLHNRGVDPVLELACGLSVLNEWTKRFTAKNVSIELSVDTSFFPSISKLRAARFLFERILPKDSGSLNIHSVTSPAELSTLDPEVNLLRLTTMAMSSMIGAADSVSLYSHSSPFSSFNFYNYLLAKNIPLLLENESFLHYVQDASAGSGYIETLSVKLAERAWDLFLEMENEGSFAEAFRKGWMHSKVKEYSSAKMEKLAIRKEIRIAVNQFPRETETQTERLVRMESSVKINSGEGKINPAYPGNKKLSEITQLFEALGEYGVLPTMNAYTGFEQIRARTEKHVVETGTRPIVYLCEFGDLTMRRARSGFAKDLLRLAGFEIVSGSFPDDFEKAIIEIEKINPSFVVLCSSDAEYQTRGKELISKLKTNAGIIFAGKISNHDELSKGSRCIFARMNVVEFLNQLISEWEGERAHV